MNEFDRFVRHRLKPLAYVRYGDDFLVFAKTRAEAKRFEAESTKFLYEELYLTVNNRNNVVCRATDGLKFLGHAITGNYAVVDKHTTKSAMNKVNLTNVSSYKSLPLASEAQEQLNYKLLQQIIDIDKTM